MTNYLITLVAVLSFLLGVLTAAVIGGLWIFREMFAGRLAVLRRDPKRPADEFRESFLE